MRSTGKSWNSTRGAASLVVALGLIPFTAAPGQETQPTTAPKTQPEAPAFERPGFQFLRFNEDWSVLRNAPESAKTDFWDPIKYVPLTKDGDVWLSFGGSTRARLEYWDNFAFGAPAENNDTFLLWRMFLHADLHVGKNIRGFIQGKTSQATSRDLPGGHRTLDTDSLDLEQAFIDVKIPIGEKATLTVRPGRQLYLFGKQRLVSPLAWSNTQRRWDGITGILKWGDWTFTGFYSYFTPVRQHEFNKGDDNTPFYGVYATGKIPNTTVGLDLYFLGLERDNVTFNGTSGDEDRYTLGGRLFGKVGASALSYDVEGAYQFGEVGSDDIDAAMFSFELAYPLADVWGAPKLTAGLDWASGDEEEGGKVNTFNQLFPLGHAYLGYIDIVGRQNIIDWHMGVTLTPMRKMTLGVTGHLFWRAEDADALYNAGGGVVRPGGGSSSKEVGSEIDLTLKYSFNRHLVGLVGYSHFFAGDFISDTGASSDIDFLYAQVQYTF